MIVQAGLLKDLNVLARSGFNPITGIPFQWDEDELKFKINRKWYLNVGFLSAFTTGSTFVHILGSLFFREHSSPLSWSHLSMTFIMFTGYLLGSYYCYKSYEEHESVEALVNQLAQMESRHVKKNKNMTKQSMAWLALPVLKIGRITAGAMLPPWLAISCAIKPGMPIDLMSYPNKWILEMCCLLQVPYLDRILVLGWNLVLYHYLCKLWCLVLAQIAIGCVGLSSLIISTEIRHLKKGPGDAIKLHRQVSILARVMNNLGSTVLVLLLIHILNTQINFGSILLRKKENVSGPMRVSMTGSVSNTFIAINLVFGFCANVHELSKKCLKRIQKPKDVVKSKPSLTDKCLKKEVESLLKIKANFGDMNFIDKVTPVRFQEYAIARIIEFVLLSKSK